MAPTPASATQPHPRISASTGSPTAGGDAASPSGAVRRHTAAHYARPCGVSHAGERLVLSLEHIALHAHRGKQYGHRPQKVCPRKCGGSGRQAPERRASSRRSSPAAQLLGLQRRQQGSSFPLRTASAGSTAEGDGYSAAHPLAAQSVVVGLQGSSAGTSSPGVATIRSTPAAAPAAAPNRDAASINKPGPGSRR